jgi:hypothetical protein
MDARWKSRGLALLIVAAGGCLRLPLEQRYTREIRAQHLLEEPLKISLRDELGQTFFIAVLGGFRSAVASIMELKTITPWVQSNWGIVDQYYAVCTKLQPREEHYWEHRAWHLAANARDSYLWNSMLTEANRRALAQEFVEKGIEVVREGLTYRPDSWKLWDRLAYYLSMPWNENPDHAAAAEYYAKAAELSGRALYWRLHVYQVARIPGREREAWDKLLALYNSPDAMHRTPTVEIELIRLFRDRRHLLDSDAKLPDALFRLFDPSAILTKEEKARAAWLIERVHERAGRSAPRERPPRLESPNLPRR